MKQLYVVGCSHYSTEALTPEIAWALLTAADPSRNISRAFEQYSDACLAATYFSEQQGKKCPIIRIEVNHPGEVYLQSNNWNLENLPYISRRYNVYMDERKQLISSQTALLIKDASFQHSPDYVPEITFNYNHLTLDFKKISEELIRLSEALYREQMGNANAKKTDKKADNKKAASEPVKEPELAVSPAPVIEQPVLPAMPPAPAQNNDSLPEKAPEDFLSITLMHERENHQLAVKSLTTMIETLGAEKHNLMLKNLDLETKLNTRRQKFLTQFKTKVWADVLFFLPRVTVATGIVAATFSLLGGMAFSSTLIYACASAGALLAVKRLADFAYYAKNRFFSNAQNVEVELRDQKEAFSDFAFALNYDNDSNPVARDINELLSENLTPSEQLKTLHWLNPLLTSTAFSDSDKDLVEQLKTKLKK